MVEPEAKLKLQINFAAWSSRDARDGEKTTAITKKKKGPLAFCMASFQNVIGNQNLRFATIYDVVDCIGKLSMFLLVCLFVSLFVCIFDAVVVLRLSIL